MKQLSIVLLLAPFLAIASALAGDKSDKTAVATMHMVNESGTGESIGEVHVKQTKHGAVFKPDLKDLSPGQHGFHVHTNPDCGPKEKDGEVTPGGAAGGHYDPKDQGSHGTPWGEGHLGDLPTLYVNDEGEAKTPVLAPRVKVKDLEDRALMIHAGGDNYSDDPQPLGGGGARVACGVFGS